MTSKADHIEQHFDPGLFQEAPEMLSTDRARRLIPNDAQSVVLYRMHTVSVRRVHTVDTYCVFTAEVVTADPTIALLVVPQGECPPALAQWGQDAEAWPVRTSVKAVAHMVLDAGPQSARFLMQAGKDLKITSFIRTGKPTAEQVHHNQSVQCTAPHVFLMLTGCWQYGDLFTYFGTRPAADPSQPEQAWRLTTQVSAPAQTPDWHAGLPPYPGTEPSQVFETPIPVCVLLATAPRVPPPAFVQAMGGDPDDNLLCASVLDMTPAKSMWLPKDTPRVPPPPPSNVVHLPPRGT